MPDGEHPRSAAAVLGGDACGQGVQHLPQPAGVPPGALSAALAALPGLRASRVSTWLHPWHTADP